MVYVYYKQLFTIIYGVSIIVYPWHILGVDRPPSPARKKRKKWLDLGERLWEMSHFGDYLWQWMYMYILYDEYIYIYIISYIYMYMFIYVYYTYGNMISIDI